MKKEKRTNVDFKDHILITKKTDDILIHHLKKPDTMTHNIKFINTNGVLVVTGDYGNWIFCREFHPSKDGYVSDGYWIEKLEIHSEQKGREFDKEATKKEIKELLEDGEYQSNEEQEYLRDLLDYIDYTEWEYEYRAYNEKPNNLDFECIPFVKSTKYYLLVIFDAFEEICRRLEE